MADYPNSAFYPAAPSNYTAANRPHSHRIDRIVVHVTQGSYASALNWFQNPAAGVSAHYTVRSTDGSVGQSVREQDIAWHAGNWTYNQSSIGIEHEGYVSDPSWFTDTMYRSSAKLSAYLCEKYKIPIDREHIIGHNEVPGATHTDPGPYWDWSRYMDLVAGYAGGAPSYSRVVNAASRRLEASGAWKSGFYGSRSVRYTSPESISDPACFRYAVPHSGAYAIHARWPASARHNSSTPVGIKTTSGLKWVRVDQRANGGRWNHLGTFELAAGANEIFISRWTSTKGRIIADAVKIVSR